MLPLLVNLSPVMDNCIITRIAAGHACDVLAKLGPQLSAELLAVMENEKARLEIFATLELGLLMKVVAAADETQFHALMQVY